MKWFLPVLIAFSLLTGTLSGQKSSFSGLTQSLNDHVEYLASEDLQGRGLGTRGKDLATDYIENQFREIGLSTYRPQGYRQVFEVRAGLAVVPATNLIGVIEGNDPALKEEFIVIGAHYDHLGYSADPAEPSVTFPGADDNASGVAVMIELARYFQNNRDNVKRSLVFIAFDAEESGLLGSWHFVRTDTVFPRHAIRAMFSLDMLGRYNSSGHLQLEGMATLAEGAEMALGSANETSVKVSRLNNHVSPGTDTGPFGEIGIPAIHAFTGLHSEYHEPGDSAGLVEFEGMAEVTLFLASLIDRMASHPNLLPSPRYHSTEKRALLRMSIGIQAGAGGARYILPDGFFNAKGIFAWQAGFFVQIHPSKRFTLQPEVNYISDGGKTAEGVFGRHSVMAPLNLQCNIVNQGNGQVRLFPFAGGYYQYIFGGSHGDKHADFTDHFQNQEWGFNAGLGFDVRHVQIRYVWQRALTSASVSGQQTLYPSRFLFSIGYKFGN